MPVARAARRHSAPPNWQSHRWICCLGRVRAAQNHHRSTSQGHNFWQLNPKTMKTTQYEQISDPLAQAATYMLEESKSARPQLRIDVMFGVSWLIDDREGGWGKALRRMAEELQDLQREVSSHVAERRHAVPEGITGVALQFMIEHLEGEPLALQLELLREPIDIGLTGHKFCQKAFATYHTLCSRIADFERRFDTFVFQIRSGQWDRSFAEALLQAKAAGAVSGAAPSVEAAAPLSNPANPAASPKGGKKQKVG